MDTVRLRLVFEHRHILSKSQKSEGLKRSWLLLSPQHETISDLSSNIAHIFDLHHSCPNGIILTMDGFVLPPFESTSILKDKDVIRVKRKGVMLSETIEVGEGANLIEEEEIVEKQPVLTGVPLIANEEFEKETGGDQSVPEEDEDNQSEGTLLVDNSSSGNAISKKRKASKRLQSSKTKKKRTIVPLDIENDCQAEQNDSCQNGGIHHGKRIDKKEKVSDVKSRPNRSAGRDGDIVEPLPSSKSFGKLQENGAGCVDTPQTTDGTRKVPSRSTRRKYAKRKWLRELVKAEEELQQRQSPEKHMPKNSVEHQEQNQNGEADDEIVPIVIRPGHIRFEPLGKDQAVQKSQASAETIHWNGITSKKKGQKWGKEKFPSCRRNDYEDSNREYSKMMTIQKVKPPNDLLDFDRLAPFASLPKKGDVIAYRLLELSSTWTPELSSFRVGKTSWYNPQSNRVLLRPVREYPIVFEKKPEEDAWAQQPDNSLYRKDGSLEIGFSSLIDVRIIKHGNSDPAKAVTGSSSDGPVGNEVTRSTVALSNYDKQTQAPTPEKEVNVWDEFSQALSAKKAQLVRKTGWSNESSGTSSWSCRALRGSALGPTMAILRARKDI